MKLLLRMLCGGALALALSDHSALAADLLAGHWEGAISLPGTELGIRLDFTSSGDGSPAGTIDIPLQGVRGFALADIATDGADVRFAMPGIPGDPVFSGTVVGDALGGTFRQNGHAFPFAVNRGERAPTTEGATPSAGVPGEDLAGVWQGSLRSGPIELRLVLHATKTADGYAIALDSLDQGATGIPGEALAADGEQVELAFPRVQGHYAGTFDNGRSALRGTWSQGGGSLPLTFYRLDQAPEISRPQNPSAPFPYEARDVKIPNPEAGIELAGTLTIPEGPGPFPAVVLLSGSGPQDRDESLLGHKPFLVLADHLTRHGIAVLRYDDRGVRDSGGDYPSATHLDFASDGEAAWRFLRHQDRIDPARVGLCGHSEGGVHGPIIAAREPAVAFLVLLAGVGVPLDQLLQRQQTDILRAMGIEQLLTDEQRAHNREIFQRLRADGDTPDNRAAVATLLATMDEGYSPEARAALGISEAATAQQLRVLFSPWFRQLLAYDPRPTLRQVSCPVLAINGTLDLQVAAEPNLEAIRAALAAGGNAEVTTRALPGLNHLFQTATTGAPSEYGLIEETFAPAALRAVADWIQATVAK